MTLDALTAPVAASFVALAVALVALVVLHIRSRRSIVFDAWSDFAQDDGSGDRGKSLADLMLFDIREIQNAHTRSGRELDLKNAYDDIPPFQQALDTDLKAAVELQRESRFVGPIVGLLMALIPTRPARLRGSIHRFGDELRVNVVLENPRRSSIGRGLQWTGSRSNAEQLPDLIEELAYEIYLGLAGSAAFTNPAAFRHYTEALSSHLAYGSCLDDDERTRAEELYELARELEPRNSAVLYNLGVLHYYMFEEDRNRQAEQCFSTAKAAAHGRLRAQIHSGLANVYCMKFHRFKSARLADLETAIDHAEEALSIDDGLDVVLKAAAFAHHQSSEAQEAQRARAATGSEERTCARAAVAHRVKAVTYYRRAIAANPSYFTAHNNLGNFYLELAKVTGHRRTRQELLRAAVDLFEETMTIRPSYHHAYDNLANAYYELALMGEDRLFERAARSFRDAIAITPRYAEAHNDLAMLYLTPQWTDHNEAKALKIHRDALDSAPDDDRRRDLERRFEARRRSNASGVSPAVADINARRIARSAHRRRLRQRVLAGLSRGRLSAAPGRFSR